MHHARVKAQDLRFHLLERSVHPELFDVLRRADLSGEGWRASLAITGQSHVVAVRAGRETVTEVVAPAGAGLPRISTRASVPLGRILCEEVRREEGAIRWGSRVRVERHAPAEFRDRAARLLAGQSLDRLKAFFDEDLGFTTNAAGAARAPEMVPFALMDFRHDPRGRLEVVSVHACPQELVMVEVETRVEVAAEAA